MYDLMIDLMVVLYCRTTPMTHPRDDGAPTDELNQRMHKLATTLVNECKRTRSNSTEWDEALGTKLMLDARFGRLDS
jgi:hypothetical protein